MRIDLTSNAMKAYKELFGNFISELSSSNRKLFDELNKITEKTKYIKVQELVTDILQKYNDLIGIHLSSNIIRKWIESDKSLVAIMKVYEVGEKAERNCRNVENAILDITSSELKVIEIKSSKLDETIVSDEDFEEIKNILKNNNTLVNSLISKTLAKCRNLIEENDAYISMYYLILAFSNRINTLYPDANKLVEKLHAETIKELGIASRLTKEAKETASKLLHKSKDAAIEVAEASIDAAKGIALDKINALHEDAGESKSDINKPDESSGENNGNSNSTVEDKADSTGTANKSSVKNTGKTEATIKEKIVGSVIKGVSSNLPTNIQDIIDKIPEKAIDLIGDNLDGMISTVPAPMQTAIKTAMPIAKELLANVSKGSTVKPSENNGETKEHSNVKSNDTKENNIKEIKTNADNTNTEGDNVKQEKVIGKNEGISSNIKPVSNYKDTKTEGKSTKDEHAISENRNDIHGKKENNPEKGIIKESYREIHREVFRETVVNNGNSNTKEAKNSDENELNHNKINSNGLKDNKNHDINYRESYAANNSDRTPLDSKPQYHYDKIRTNGNNSSDTIDSDKVHSYQPNQTGNDSNTYYKVRENNLNNNELPKNTGSKHSDSHTPTQPLLRNKPNNEVNLRSVGGIRGDNAKVNVSINTPELNNENIMQTQIDTLLSNCMIDASNIINSVFNYLRTLGSDDIKIIHKLFDTLDEIFNNIIKTDYTLKLIGILQKNNIKWHSQYDYKYTVIAQMLEYDNIRNKVVQLYGNDIIELLSNLSSMNDLEISIMRFCLDYYIIMVINDEPKPVYSTTLYRLLKSYRNGLNRENDTKNILLIMSTYEILEYKHKIKELETNVDRQSAWRILFKKCLDLLGNHTLDREKLDKFFSLRLLWLEQTYNINLLDYYR